MLKKKKIRPSALERAEFFYQLAMLLRSGMTPKASLAEVVAAVEDKQDGHALLCEQMLSLMQKGKSFAEALLIHMNLEVRDFLLIEAVEKRKGGLYRVLKAIAERLEREDQLEQKIKLVVGSSLYSLLLLLLLIPFFSYHIIPAFAEMYGHFGMELPEMTQFLFLLGDYGRILFPLLALMLLVGKIALHFNPSWRRALLTVFFPFFSRESFFIRFFEQVSLLLRSGLSFTEAVPVVVSMEKEGNFSEQLKTLSSSFANDQQLLTALRKCGCFSPFHLSQVAVGVRSGQLMDLLRHSARLQNRRLEKRLLHWLRIIKVLTYFVVGSIVAFVVLAVYLPIFNLGGVLG
ncbi:type II secretion system F family protein [Magnetococcales bacterium HHB-1]